MQKYPQQIVKTYYEELTIQPYSGFFLFFLLMEDYNEQSKLIENVMVNVNDFDYIAYLIVKNIEDPIEYYDVNRVHKLKDKLTPEVVPCLHKVISSLKKLTKELNPK